MELSTNRVLKVNQSEIEEAILNLVFKRKPDLRPNGTDPSEPPPQIAFQISEKTGVMATIMLENKSEEVVKP
ncbi:MAG: hypothetical protein DRP42_07005 [Tenericutes bacterium]|nr:MAG: hypothetical protein DRP42_07005 [Mycoplasmatota bacterium]